MTFDHSARPRLPHLAYLESLAHSEEASPRWNAVTAGYAALQLFEVWAGYDCGTIPLSALELRRVRKRIAAVSEADPIRRCLVQLVDVVERSAPPHGTDEHRLRGLEVGRVLAAYGKLLQYEACWSLAQDVFETLIAYAQCVDDEERLLDSMLMVGYCLRMLGQFEDARDAYSVLRETAADVGSEQYLLLSELGFAKIAVERGNLPAAAGMLDQLITETQEEEHVAIRAKALMDRARVANQLGDYATATLLGHEALTLTNDPVDRDRALGNLAMTFTQMGLWEQARDANLVLSATAQEITVRWIANLNLMELAYLEEREPVFERYRRKLSETEFPPYVQAVFFETLAHGCRTFGREIEAARAFEQMRDVGARYGLNEFTVRAESALEDVMSAVGPVDGSRRCRVSEQPREVADVAHAITEMREMAGVEE